jgi:hypothetical protein
MTETIKVYPIRMTRKNWIIPIVSSHECDSKCMITIKKQRENSEDIFYITANELFDGEKCNLKGKLQKTTVNLHSFDDNCRSFIGPLYNSDNIVIPDKDIKMIINFPLLRMTNITIKSPGDNGFTLKQLLLIIKNVYEYIYSEEERTASVRNFTYKKICNLCLFNKKINELLIPTVLEEECCICYDIEEEKGLKLPCEHSFHEKCINKWIENSLTCPLCRKNINNCENCHGEGFITCNFTGKVIPREERGVFMNRNITDGIFGIYNYDFEDLYINNLFYDNVKKVLSLDINI